MGINIGVSLSISDAGLHRPALHSGGEKISQAPVDTSGEKIYQGKVTGVFSVGQRAGRRTKGGLRCPSFGVSDRAKPPAYATIRGRTNALPYGSDRTGRPQP